MIQYGTTVVVNYTGTLEDGSIFDSTEGREPFEFSIGSGMVIHGFDEAVRVMEEGEVKTVVIPAKDAYGEHDPAKVETAPMYSIPNAKDIRIGKPFYFITEEGACFPATVTEIRQGIATVDFNNPLAGKDLIFEIELLEVRR